MGGREDHIKKLQPGHILLVNCILLIVDFHHGHNNKNKYHIKVLINFHHFHSSEVVSSISSTDRDLGVDNLQ